MKSTFLFLIIINISIVALALANVYMTFLNDTTHEMGVWIIVIVQTIQVLMLCITLERRKEVEECPIN